MWPFNKRKHKFEYRQYPVGTYPVIKDTPKSENVEYGGDAFPIPQTLAKDSPKPVETTRKKITDVRDLPEHVQDVLNTLYRKRASEEDKLEDLEQSYAVTKASHLEEIRIIDESIIAFQKANEVYQNLDPIRSDIAEAIDQELKQIATDQQTEIDATDNIEQFLQETAVNPIPSQPSEIPPIKQEDVAKAVRESRQKSRTSKNRLK